MKPKQKYNIVFIVIDTHRRDRLGLYGYPRGTSPNIDAFANEATVYDNAISPAQWTIPSHASMFTGEYPSTHLTTQPGHSLDPYFKTLADLLSNNGYHCIGFCNNPLVGVLDNGLKRGYKTFYNYGGAIPSTPAHASKSVLSPLANIWERYTQLLRKISYPIQNKVARSDQVFQLTLKPLFVPLWTRFANFKGDTIRSIQDSTEYIRKNFDTKVDVPEFIFINLMETHLPFTPPEPFIQKFAPIFKHDLESRDFLRVYNSQALRWLLPMDEPFSELEAKTLSDFYDAEVAYQDHLLAELFEELDQPYHRENTMVILVADHGEMLGEHSLMGHSFRVYQELVQVPFVIRFPTQGKPARVEAPVSTLRLFHTILDLTETHIPAKEDRNQFENLSNRIEHLSLKRKTKKSSPSNIPVFSEAFPPKNVLKIMEATNPSLIKKFISQSTYRAAYDQKGYKLVRAEGIEDTLYDLSNDPNELSSMTPEGEHLHLCAMVDQFLENAVQRRPEIWSRKDFQIDDEKLLQRLRALGYID